MVDFSQVAGNNRSKNEYEDNWNVTSNRDLLVNLNGYQNYG